MDILTLSIIQDQTQLSQRNILEINETVILDLTYMVDLLTNKRNKTPNVMYFQTKMLIDWIHKNTFHGEDDLNVQIRNAPNR